MRQEDKELLLKDVCARLPYRVMIQVKDWALIDTELTTGHIELLQYDKTELKPYLRPLSSMTREELKELRDIFNNIIDFDEWGLDILNSDFKRFSYLELLAIFDWFNKHHFDYLNLIEKGLAIVAPKGMYN